MLIKLSRYVINTDYIIYSEDDSELSTVIIHMWFPSEGVRNLTIIDDDRLKYLSAVSEKSSTK